MGAPKVTIVLADGPEASDSFTNKAVEVAFTIGAMAGAKVDRFEAGAGHELVESVEGVVLLESSESNVRSIVVCWLHQDKGHADIRPVGFEEDGDCIVKVGKAGVTSDSELEFVKQGR